MFYKRISMGVLASAVVATVIWSPCALSQQRLQLPDGRQTVAPSEMPQQPSLNEEFSKRGNITDKVVPNPVLDQPGLPGVQLPVPRIGPDADVPNTSADPRPERKDMQPTAPGAKPDPGALVFPQGYSSSVRIGPLEPIPQWHRMALTVALLVQCALLFVVAFAMYRQHAIHVNRFQGGKDINEDYREGWLQQSSGHAARHV